MQSVASLSSSIPPSLSFSFLRSTFFRDNNNVRNETTSDNDDDDHMKCTNKQAIAHFLNNKSAFSDAHNAKKKTRKRY